MDENEHVMWTITVRDPSDKNTYYVKRPVKNCDACCFFNEGKCNIVKTLHRKGMKDVCEVEEVHFDKIVYGRRGLVRKEYEDERQFK